VTIQTSYRAVSEGPLSINQLLLLLPQDSPLRSSLYFSSSFHNTTSCFLPSLEPYKKWFLQSRKLQKVLTSWTTSGTTRPHDPLKPTTFRTGTTKLCASQWEGAGLHLHGYHQQQQFIEYTKTLMTFPYILILETWILNKKVNRFLFGSCERISFLFVIFPFSHDISSRPRMRREQ